MGLGFFYGKVMRIELGPPRYNEPARKTDNEFEAGLPFQHSGFRTQVQG